MLMYLDQRSPPKEESKEIGPDVITDHYGDRDNEPAEENFHSIRKLGASFHCSENLINPACGWKMCAKYYKFLIFNTVIMFIALLANFIT